MAELVAEVEGTRIVGWRSRVGSLFGMSGQTAKCCLSILGLQQGLRHSPLDARIFWQEGLLAQATMSMEIMRKPWPGHPPLSGEMNPLDSPSARLLPLLLRLGRQMKQLKSRAICLHFSQISGLDCTLNAAHFRVRYWTIGSRA
jgi:hypothetical protein